MIELSRTQDEEVGDGTTSVIILAGEVLGSSLVFLERYVNYKCSTVDFQPQSILAGIL
jgi:chaperonin GroEL (HSP60 family)